MLKVITVVTTEKRVLYTKGNEKEFKHFTTKKKNQLDQRENSKAQNERQKS